MSVVIKRVCAVLAAACVIAIAVGDKVIAQNPPASGMRWSKAAPFPEPEEELYALGDQRQALRRRRIRLHAAGRHAAAADLSKRVPASAARRRSSMSTTRRPDKWTKKKTHPGARAPSGAGGLQRQALHLRRLHAGDQRRRRQHEHVGVRPGCRLLQGAGADSGEALFRALRKKSAERSTSSAASSRSKTAWARG